MASDTNIAGTVAPAQPVSSRRGFLRSSSLAAAGVLAVPVVASLSSKASAAAGAGGIGDLGRSVAQARKDFRSIQAHENTHVAFLRSALGSAARPKPTFKNLLAPDLATFITLAQAFENTGVGAYLGAAPLIFSKAYLAAAGSILTVEARHAGILNDIREAFPATSPFNSGSDPAFDAPVTGNTIRGQIIYYVQSLNGGPDVRYDQATPSATNDIAILNFALALEYLEAEFYNLNVPKFF